MATTTVCLFVKSLLRKLSSLDPSAPTGRLANFELAWRVFRIKWPPLTLTSLGAPADERAAVSEQ